MLWSKLEALIATREAASLVKSLNGLKRQIQACEVCKPHLSHGVRPVLQVEAQAKLLIIGQAPGLKVHQSGVPWDDASGDRLRSWLSIDKERFYGPEVALLPMGFCYPGKGNSGDLPPRPECATLWHQPLLEHLNNVRLTLLVGAYAQNHYLAAPKRTLTETVRHYQDYLPQFLPLPHPSPRNNIWLKKNPWFAQEVLPLLRTIF